MQCDWKYQTTYSGSVFPFSPCVPLFLGRILLFLPTNARTWHDQRSGAKGLLSHSMVVFVLHMHRQLCHPVECCTRWVHRGHAIGSVSRKTWGDVTPIPFDEISMSFNVSPGGWTEPQGICSTSEEKTAEKRRCHRYNTPPCVCTWSASRDTAYRFLNREIN